MTPIAFLYWFALFETDFISKNLNSTNSRGMATAIGLPILGPFIALEGDSVLGWSCNLLVISVVAYYFLYWRPNNPVEL